MLIFNEISSGGPGLFFAVALWMLFRYALQDNLHTSWLHTCCLFFKQLASPMYKKYKVEPKGRFSNSSTGLSLFSFFSPPGISPVVKSSRPDFYALLSGSVQKAGFLLGIFVMLSFSQVKAVTISSTGTGGNWSAAATWVGSSVPVAGDDVTIASGATVTIDSDATVNSLNISGTLQYEVSTARTLAVVGIVTINSGGIFRSAQSGTIKTHQLIAQGSIINSGTIDFSSMSNTTGALIKFSGSSTGTFNCGSAVLTNLQKVDGLVIEKGSTATWVTFTPGGTFQVLSGTTEGFLTITSGTFRIIGTNSFSNPVFNLASYTIPANGGFELNNSSATVVGQFGSVDNKGQLTISAGTFNIGTASGNSSVTNSSGKFELSGGILNIAGRFQVSGASALITGGTMNLSTFGNGDANEATFHVTLASNLTISGTPLITFTRSNSSIPTPFNDIEILNGSGFKSITRGTFQMGTAATPATSTFLVNSDVPIYNLTVFDSDSKVSLADNLTVNNQLTLNGQLLLNAENLILGSAAPAITGTFGTTAGMIVAGTGEVRKLIASNSTYTFPIGDASGTTDYTPVSLTFTGGTFNSGAYVNVDVFNIKHPNNTSTTNYLNRYWTVTTNGITSPVYNLTATYADGDIAGVGANIAAGVYGTALPWTKYIGAVAPLTNTISITGISSSNTSITGIRLDPPTVTITATNSSICNGASTTLTANPVGDAPFSYVWSPVTGLSSTNTTSTTANPTATTNYIVTVTDGNGFTASATTTVTVLPDNTVSAASSTPTVCINTALTPITYTTTGATGIGTPTGLPAGVTTLWASNTITISGTPTVSGPFNYNIPLTGGCGTVTATGTITVTPNMTVTAASSTPTLCINTALTAITHTTTGATGIGSAIGLPTGVTAAWASNTITISGTPTVSGPFNYSIPLTGGCGTVTATGTITVTPNMTVTAASSTPTLCINTVLTAITHTTAGATNIGAATGLPTGVTAVWASNTITISGTPSVSGTFNYSIPLTGGCGTVTATGTITVTPNNTITLTSAGGTDSQSKCINSAITNITYATTGATGATFSNLPTGVNGSWGANVATISGTPSVSGTYTYTITLTGGCGNITATGTITVNPIPTVSATPASPTICPGGSFTISISNTNSVPGTTFSWTRDNIGTLTGVGASGTGTTISGVLNSSQPTTTTTTTFTIIATANGCSSQTTAAITVLDNIAPTFTVPGPTTIYTAANCSFDKDPAQTGSPNPLTMADNCTATASLTITYTDTATPNAFCGGSNIITRTWSVKDLSGNTTTKTQVITIEDKIAPLITVPGDKSVQCGGNTFPYAVGLNPGTETATATDNCGGTITITSTDAIAGNTCNKTITRTWRATDPCGNFATGVQYIYVNDTQAPTIVSTGNITVACPANIPLANPNVISATDNCGTVSVTLFDEVSNGLDTKPGYCPTSVTRVYRVEDSCGNYTNATQTITVGYTGTSCTTCAACATQDAFRVVDLLGNPSGTWTATVTRADKCCDASGPQMWCASFNVRLDPDAVGVEILVDGVTPPGQDWKQDCVTINGGNIVCLTGGTFHLFTYCKNGNGAPQLTNKYTFRSIKGAAASSDLSTRVDCSGQLHVTGVTGPVWHSVYPDAPNAYDSYLNLADPFNPVFTAPAGSPPEIRYQVCGNIGSTVCGGTSTDCDIVTVYVKPKIAITISVNADLVCDKNSIPTITPAIIPAGNYLLDWYGPGGTVTRTASFTPPDAGTYTVVATDVQSGILCNSGTTTFTIAFDDKGPNFQTTPPPLQIQCNDANYVSVINAWRATAQASYINSQGNTVTATVTDDFNFAKLNMTCGNVVTVTFTAPDQCVNYSITTSTITVIDKIKPTITTQASNLTVECDGAGNIAARNAWLASNGGAIGVDDCGAVTWTNNYIGLSALCGMTGVATVTFTASDACGNKATSTGTFRIIDTTPPSITCPGPYYQNAIPGTCSYTPVTLGTVTATDACGGLVSVTNNAPATFPVGTTTVTWTATDACGNVATCSQFVTIYDVQPPVIICIPGVYTGTVGPGNCGTPVGIVTPTYTENCGAPITVAVLRSDGLAISADFPVGITTVVWTVTDASNNATTCTQTVVVTDNIVPTISCPANVTVTAPPPSCQMQVLTIGPPTVADNCGTYTLTWTKTGTTTGTGVGDVNGTTFNGGVTTVTYTVTDAAGNSASCSFTVTVNDQVPPTIITCPPNVVENSLATLCVSTLTTIPQPAAVDPCGAIVSITHNSPYATGSSTTDASGIYPVGTTTITWFVTDNSGNVTTCTQLVTVNDRELPTLACPGNATYPADPGLPYKTNVPVPLPTYSDNCPNPVLTWIMGGATTDTSSNTTGISTVPNLYPQLNVGSTVIMYTLTDASGQTVSCSFVVTITSKPQISCAASITTYTASNNCNSILDPGVPTLIQGAQPITWTWTIDSPLSADVTGTSITTPGPIGLFTFDIGTTTITWTATNISGTDSCTQTVTVIDNIPPVYTPPPLPAEYCVENIISATYTSADPIDNLIVNPDPDFFLFRTGVNSDTSLDLNVTNLTDNCCPGTITWTITFRAVPDPASPGNTITYLPVSGSGQPSAYPSNIQLWGDGVNYIDVVHRIDYTVTDCHGNSTPVTRNITIKPRPKIVKMP